jgi:hypothetical protein
MMYAINAKESRSATDIILQDLNPKSRIPFEGMGLVISELVAARGVRPDKRGVKEGVGGGTGNLPLAVDQPCGRRAFLRVRHDAKHVGSPS